MRDPIRVTRGLSVDSMAFDKVLVGMRTHGDDRNILVTIAAEGHALSFHLDADEARNFAAALSAIARQHEDRRERVSTTIENFGRIARRGQ